MMNAITRYVRRHGAGTPPWNDTAPVREELFGVAAGHIGNAFNFFFQPQMSRIVDLREDFFVVILFADGIDNQAAAGFQIFEGFHHRLPGRGGVDDAIEHPGR